MWSILCVFSKYKELLGPLAGLVSRVCNSGPQSCEFRPHIGHRAYLKKKEILLDKSPMLPHPNILFIKNKLLLIVFKVDICIV